MSNDPLGDDEFNRRVEEQHKRLKERFQGDLRRVLGSIEGRRVLWKIMAEAGVLRSAFNTNGLVMAHQTGKQDIGIFVIKSIVEAQPDMLLKMQTEAAADKKQQDADLQKEEVTENE